MGKHLSCLPPETSLPSVLRWGQGWHRSAALFVGLPVRLWISLRLKSLAHVDIIFLILQLNCFPSGQISSWGQRGHMAKGHEGETGGPMCGEDWELSGPNAKCLSNINHCPNIPLSSQSSDSHHFCSGAKMNHSANSECYKHNPLD